MKHRVFGLLTASLAAGLYLMAADPSADLSHVKTVYLMPMSGGLDQYLAIRLSGGATFQVVTDPKKADAIFTDRIGTGFEKSLQDLVAPPKTKDDGKLASADFTQATSQSFSKGKGSLFLVDRQSHVVVWSIYAKPKNNESEELNRLAAKIADQLGKDRAAKK
jgi:hypothetical protein